MAPKRNTSAASTACSLADSSARMKLRSSGNVSTSTDELQKSIPPPPRGVKRPFAGRKELGTFPARVKSRCQTQPAKRTHFDSKVYPQHSTPEAIIILDDEEDDEEDDGDELPSGMDENDPHSRLNLPAQKLRSPNSERKPPVCPGKAIDEANSEEDIITKEPAPQPGSTSSIANEHSDRRICLREARMTPPTKPRSQLGKKTQDNPPDPLLKQILARRSRRTNGKLDRADGPSYALRDEDGNIVGDFRESLPYKKAESAFKARLYDLWESIYHFSKHYFAREIEEDEKGQWLQELDRKMSPEFVRFAGFIAAGGPCGVAGWEEIFLTGELRAALVSGIIWKVIREHIFSSLLFGGSKEQLDELERLEIKNWAMTEGFSRTKARGEKIREWLRAEERIASGYRYPTHYHSDTLILAVQLYTMVNCLRDEETDNYRENLVLSGMHDLLKLAATLSIHMRLDPDAIYYFPPTPKDTPFERDSMNTFSEKHHAWLVNPRNRPDHTSVDEKVGLRDDKLRKVLRYSTLTRIIAFGGCQVYRRGGWRPEDNMKGWRKTTLSKAVVALRWGTPRRFGKKNDGKEGEFVELRDCKGKLGMAERMLRGSRSASVPWWEREDVRDPAHAAFNVPVLGLKGKGCQPPLAGFEPKGW